MLTKKTYRQVLKNLEIFQKQEEEDKAENPQAIPIDWGSSIARMIENTVRNNHERYYKGLDKETMDYLVSKGILVNYVGGYTFPGRELPTLEEIVDKAKEFLK